MSLSALIYARYSSDLQNAASIDDQVRLCRERLDQDQIEVRDVFVDRAVSGSSLHTRAGIKALLDEVARSTVDIVIAEALDRLSRDQEDIARIYKRLSFAQVSLMTLAEGEINELHIGLKGTMNALFLKDLADKTRRGQRGRVEAGKIPGGTTLSDQISNHCLVFSNKKRKPLCNRLKSRSFDSGKVVRRVACHCSC